MADHREQEQDDLPSGRPLADRTWKIPAAAFAAVVVIVAALIYLSQGEPRSTGQTSKDVVKEGICQTIPAGGQVDMNNEGCTFIANKIGVLSRERSEPVAVEYTAVPRLKPGDVVPANIDQTKALPPEVVQRYPALENHEYFLTGQDIVVVTDQRRVAFVINVRVRPHAQGPAVGR